MRLHQALLASAAVLALSFNVQAQTKWDLPAAYPATNFHSVNLQQFADDVDKATGGKLKITVHENASLFKTAQAAQAPDARTPAPRTDAQLVALFDYWQAEQAAGRMTRDQARAQAQSLSPEEQQRLRAAVTARNEAAAQRSAEALAAAERSGAEAERSGAEATRAREAAQEQARRSEEEARRAQEESRRSAEAVRRSEEEARRAQEEARRSQEEARRAQEEARRAQEELRRAWQRTRDALGK
jgi:hypothetical protein